MYISKKILDFLIAVQLDSNKKYIDIEYNGINFRLGRNVTFLGGIDIHKNVYIESECIIGKDCSFGEDVNIKKNCSIGDNTRILESTKIWENCVIDKNCNIGKNCVLEKNVRVYFGVKMHIGVILRNSSFINKSCDLLPHIEIDEFCYIGCECTIKQNSYVGKHTRVEDGCTIGASSYISDRCVIPTRSKISNTVKIENDCKFSGEVCIKWGTHIKKNSKIPCFNYVYKYHAHPIPDYSKGYLIQYIRLGGYIRTREEWEKDFWIEEKEFPKLEGKNINNIKSKKRKLAFNMICQWFDLHYQTK